jgi:hypothetical protein
MGNKCTKPAYTSQEEDTFLNYKYTQISALNDNGCMDIALQTTKDIAKYCKEYTDDEMKRLYRYKYLYCYVPVSTCKTDFNLSIYNSLEILYKTKYLQHFTNIATNSFNHLGHWNTWDGFTMMLFLNKHYIVQGSSEGITLDDYKITKESKYILKNIKNHLYIDQTYISSVGSSTDSMKSFQDFKWEDEELPLLKAQ